MVFVRYIKASCSYLSSGITYFFVKKKTKEEHMANEEVALQPVESKRYLQKLYFAFNTTDIKRKIYALTFFTVTILSL